MSQLLQIENFTLGFPGRPPPLLDSVSLHVNDGEAVALVGGVRLRQIADYPCRPGFVSWRLAVLRHRVGSGPRHSHSERTTPHGAATETRFHDLPGSSGGHKSRSDRGGDFLTETLVRLDGLSRAEATERAVTQLEQVGLRRAKELMDQHPHQLSGGMLQRVMIAAALLNSPDLLLCDEPTTALDVTTQAGGIVRLLREEQQSRGGMGMLFITHDLNLAASLCERVYVLRRGGSGGARANPDCLSDAGAGLHPAAG